jgi:hypothetical protein
MKEALTTLLGSLVSVEMKTPRENTLYPYSGVFSAKHVRVCEKTQNLFHECNAKAEDPRERLWGVFLVSCCGKIQDIRDRESVCALASTASCCTACLSRMPH